MGEWTMTQYLVNIMANIDVETPDEAIDCLTLAIEDIATVTRIWVFDKRKGGIVTDGKRKK